MMAVTLEKMRKIWKNIKEIINNFGYRCISKNITCAVFDFITIVAAVVDAITAERSWDAVFIRAIELIYHTCAA